MVCVALMGTTANATTYTALLSGNFNAGTTWGGIAPGSLISTDIVIIPPGITVTLTGAETFSGTSSLIVAGTLASTLSSAPIIITSGSLSGSGTIAVDSMVLGITSGLTFNGTITARNLTSTGASIAGGANVTIQSSLNLTSGTLNVSNGDITMANGSVINMAGGTVTTSGTGALHLNNSYSVVYTAASATTGIELGGTGLDSVTLNTAGNVALSANQTLNGMLTLTSGTLLLNGKTLTLGTGSDLSGSGTGTLTGSSTSNLTINATASLAGSPLFATGSELLNNLTINNGTGSMTSLGSDLTLNGLLTLNSGTLNLNGHGLTIASTGDLSGSGTGTFMGSSLSNLTINTTGSLTGTLRFATGGNMLNNLTLNSGTGSMTSLGGDLTLNGMLTLTAGTLALNGHGLTLGSTSNLSGSGSGTLTGSSLSNLTINSTSSLSGTLRFATGGNTLNNLTVNGGTSSVASLGTDLNLNGMLTLTAGSIGLNGHTLTLASSSNVAGTGSGTLTGSATSNLIINATAGLTGALRFATGGNMLNNLTLNTGSGTTSSLGSDLTIDGMLTLTSGTLGLNGHGLTIASTGDLSGSGSGTLTGSSLSNLTVNTTGGLTSALRFATGGNTLNNLTLNTGSGSTTSLGGDLTLDGMLTLTAGTLGLNGHTLTLGTGSNIAGSGSGTLTGSSLSNLTINSTSTLTGSLRFATGGNTLNNLTVNGGSSSVASLGSDLNMNGMLTLTAGSLGLNGHTLTLGTGSNIAGTGTGTITGSSTSSLIINTTGSLTGSLRFATGGDILNNLTINNGTGSTSSLGSDLTVDGMLTLTAGTLGLNGHTLTIGATGDIASTGSGTLTGSSTSNLIINTTGSLTGNLRFATGGNTLHNLTINTGSGSSTTLDGDLTLNGMLGLNAGTLNLNGHNLTMGAGSDIATTGSGSFTGSSLSDLTINSGLTGTLRFDLTGNRLRNLTLNTTSTSDVIKLGTALNVYGNLNLITGKIKLGSNSLSLVTGATLTGGNNGSYVITDGSGQLAMNLVAGSADTFEVGTMANYAPMVIIGNTGSASGDVSINVNNGVYSGGTAGSGTSLTTTDRLVNATWYVNSTATTGINYNMIAMWSNSMELNGFDRTDAYISHHTGTMWDIQTGSAATVSGSMNSMLRTGITSLSPFMVHDAHKPTSIEANTKSAGYVSLYPNPATDVLHFTTNATIENAAIYDMSGKMIANAPVMNNTVSVQALPAGQYFITLTGSDLNTTQKFIKQ
ncbi:MAG: hypothetical protein JWQ38_477 [Flavipsychrobacter sp.]|nr:hypothetical protein [Flavipsychrobacter sp.]